MIAVTWQRAHSAPCIVMEARTGYPGYCVARAEISTLDPEGCPIWFLAVRTASSLGNWGDWEYFGGERNKAQHLRTFEQVRAIVEEYAAKDFAPGSSAWERTKNHG